mmetsp:Transcript_104858/g.264229  ORF Transcript_104858/g.264229 Transcript_104858/m.264229 type:complete len:241 (-) Transcript_104858:7-729(-)
MAPSASQAAATTAGEGSVSSSRTWASKRAPSLPMEPSAAAEAALRSASLSFKSSATLGADFAPAVPKEANAEAAAQAGFRKVAGALVETPAAAKTSVDLSSPLLLRMASRADTSEAASAPMPPRALAAAATTPLCSPARSLPTAGACAAAFGPRVPKRSTAACLTLLLGSAIRAATCERWASAWLSPSFKAASPATFTFGSLSPSCCTTSATSTAMAAQPWCGMCGTWEPVAGQGVACKP